MYVFFLFFPFFAFSLVCLEEQTVYFRCEVNAITEGLEEK